MHKEVVLIACPDQTGLIFQITGVLADHGLNITETKEFVDHVSDRFFMRIEFQGATNSQVLEKQLKGVLPKSTFCQVRKFEKRKVLVFASEEPHCLGDLLLRHSSGELKAHILGIVSQVETCRSLCKRFELPFHFVPVNKLSREEHEKEILKVIRPYGADYLILARYMRIFSKSFVECYPERILNIHHSFLPSFIGKNPYEQAHERGVKIIGATAHFVTENLDEGPIITQSVINVNHSVTPMEMARRGQDVEKIVLASALDLILEDRVLIDGRRTIVFA
jgi:formyltetrahydrofolate deformylase